MSAKERRVWRSVPPFLALLALLATATACKGPATPEARCEAKCAARAQGRCAEKECERGCAFVLDRIVEREDDTVLACMSGGKGPCDDAAWAQCAAAVGVHASGAPPTNEPAIAPPSSADEE